MEARGAYRWLILPALEPICGDVEGLLKLLRDVDDLWENGLAAADIFVHLFRQLFSDHLAGVGRHLFRLTWSRGWGVIRAVVGLGAWILSWGRGWGFI